MTAVRQAGTWRLRPGSVLIAVLAASSLSGCTVGPDYAGPPVAAPRAMDAAAFHRASGAPVTAALPLAAWWSSLDDPVLNRIEQLALQASPSVAEAQAKVRGARAALHERQTALLPTGGAEALYLRAKVPTSAIASATGQSSGLTSTSSSPSSIPPLDLYDLGLDASWQIDVFGGTRRRIESARADAATQQADLEDAQVTLTADVAHAYVNLRDCQHRLELDRANVALQLRMVDLTQKRFAGGTATELDVDRLVTQLKQTAAEMPPLAAEVEIYTDQLAQLAGQEPGALEGALAVTRGLPLPPVATAIGDPAALIRRRPDIRAAERTLAAQNALIGTDIAKYFPQVTLFGTIGYTATQTSKLFAANSLTYLGGPSISWNIFNFPSISTQVAQARANTQQAAAAYRKTVLAALLDAENALSRFGHQREDVDVLADAEAAASRSAQLSDLRLAAGTTTLIDTLDIERQRLETQGSLAKGCADLTNDWVALQSSLGLGWGVR